MSRPLAWVALPIALATIAGLSGCPDHDSRLDEAISQYIEQREAENQGACECFHLFLNPDDFNHGNFTSKDECLTTLAQPPDSEIKSCIKSMLESEGISSSDSVEIVTCYANEIAENAECYMQNAGVCSESACVSDLATVDVCRGELTPESALALYYCAIQ